MDTGFLTPKLFLAMVAVITLILYFTTHYTNYSADTSDIETIKADTGTAFTFALIGSILSTVTVGGMSYMLYKGGSD